MPSCRSEQILTESVSAIKERSERNERDSIVIRDSVVVFVQGDTIYKDRWHTEYKDRVLARVDTVVRVDERVVESVVEKKVIPKWCWWMIGYGVIVTGLMLIGVLLKIKRVI